MSTTTRPALRWRGRPERVFISVDQSTGRSTISFQPVDACDPVLTENDVTGAEASREAAAIAAGFAGCTVHGPYFHAARPAGRSKIRRRPVKES
jgi:hypothetical protein